MVGCGVRLSNRLGANGNELPHALESGKNKTQNSVCHPVCDRFCQMGKNIPVRATGAVKPPCCEEGGALLGKWGWGPERERGEKREVFPDLRGRS